MLELKENKNGKWCKSLIKMCVFKYFNTSYQYSRDMRCPPYGLSFALPIDHQKCYYRIIIENHFIFKYKLYEYITVMTYCRIYLYRLNIGTIKKSPKKLLIIVFIIYIVMFQILQKISNFFSFPSHLRVTIRHAFLNEGNFEA